MKDEIREILRYLRIENGHCSSELSYEETHLLLDYITNLQQENERLETNCSELQNAIDNIAELVDVPEGMSIEDVYDKVKDYKSRVEKAVEYIEHRRERVNPEKTIYVNGNDLLNILQGDNDATN